MNNKVGTVIVIATVAAVAGAFVVRQNVARARVQALAEQAQDQDEQERLALRFKLLRDENAQLKESVSKLQAELRDKKHDHPSRWEYRFLSGTEKTINQEISKLGDDGWEFVAVIQPALPQPGGAVARLLFKRPKQ
jgi:hypothetical protein